MAVIYVLKNKVNGKLYVGQTINLKNRLRNHKGLYNLSTVISKAINKYGWDNFVQYTFYVPKADLDYFEIKMVLQLGALIPDGYNLAIGGNGGMRGFKHSAETKRKQSETRKGKHKGKENPMFGKTGEQSPNFGKHFSKEHRDKISKAHKGKPGLRGYKNPNFGKHPSAEVLVKLSESHKGYRHSEEAKRKMSEAKKGENNIMFGKRGKRSPNFGKHHSEETKRKISESHKGKPSPRKGKIGIYTKKTLRMMSQSQKAWWAKRKAQEVAA